MKNPLLLAIAIPLFSLAASDSTTTKNFKRLYIGASFNPGIAYRLLSYKPVNLEPPLTDSLFKAVFFEAREKEERPTFGFTAGCTFGVNILKWLSVETGVNYSMKGYKRTIHNLTMGTSYDSVGTLDPAKVYTLKRSAAYHYLQIPLGFNFRLGSKRTKACIRTGINFEWLLANTLKSKLNSQAGGSETFKNTSYKFQHTNTLNYSPYLGVGVSYEISKAMCLEIMPMAQIQIISTDQAPVSMRFWNAGINIAFNYGFVEAR